MDREQTIKDALDYVNSGKFKVVAGNNGEKISQNDIRKYEENAYDCIRSSTIEDLDKAYNFMLMQGVDEEDLTADELLRYRASDAYTDYDSLFIEYVILFYRESQ